MWHDKVANAYFHLKTTCLQKFDAKLKLEDITMTNEMFYSITDGHLKLLAEVGVLKYIIANKGADVQQVSIYYYLRSVTGASYEKNMQRTKRSIWKPCMLRT